jgi:ABC-2 type transport system permease protein
MLSYARFEMTRVIRNPRFMLLVALVPVLLYLVGLKQGAGAAIGAAPAGVWFLSSALALGAVASALTSSGARLAAERASGWERAMRVTPLTDAGWLAGRVLASLGIVVPVVTLVALLAVTAGHVRLTVVTWLGLLAVALLGAVPIALLGLVLGLTLRSESAQAAQAVVFLALAFFGGIFAQSAKAPATIAPVAAVTPSYHLVLALRTVAAGHFPARADLAALAAVTAVAGCAVLWLRKNRS